MNNTAITMVPPRQPDAGLTAAPKVFTNDVVNKLRLLNSTVRWLRENGHAPVEVNALGVRPCVRVAQDAAEFLCRAGHGKNTRSRNPGNERIGYVLIDGCEVRWNERAA